MVRPPRKPRLGPHAHHVPDLQPPHKLPRARLPAPALPRELVRARRVRVDVVPPAPRDAVRPGLARCDFVALDRDVVSVQERVVERRLAVPCFWDGVDGPQLAVGRGAVRFVGAVLAGSAVLLVDAWISGRVSDDLGTRRSCRGGLVLTRRAGIEPLQAGLEPRP